ncbi:hypothetical protein JOD31_002908 [Methylopila capsulata]|uniref:Cytochrome c domain-containing protein n=1 Tax=Methylopila capsulata TaxID=61654 RepID=A0A9W6IX47_9HYPH|nr:hypothetical protein [Methylopila capsulata]MBM7852666.1 hypothetical protein [Methylopila capsulata]GLK56874.1 hypothetical protein GCM10008170_28930 [Methylopila capsulata]
MRLSRRSWAAVAALAIGSVGAASAAAFLPGVRGYALYHGYATLQASVAATEVPLPTSASRCVNCHDAAPSGAPRRVVRLDRASLVQPTARRGGPVSAYDAASFCAAVREGLDPSFVILDRTMPRFALSDDDCGALWRYVSAR